MTATVSLLTTMIPFLEGLSGEWTVEVLWLGHTVRLRMELEEDGDTVTGTLRGPDGRAYPIERGRVEGDRFRFVAGGGGALAGAEVTGVADGEKLLVVLRTSQGAVQATATRAD